MECLTLLLCACASVKAFSWGEPVLRPDLRSDGVPVVLAPPGVLKVELQRTSYPFKPFSDDFVNEALSTGIDWTTEGIVTPAKDQGAHGTCGTFGRLASAEGQYALRSGHSLRNFSEEQMVDCIGWDLDQFTYAKDNGFMDSAVYPYDTAKFPGGDVDPPVPGHPCNYSRASVIVDTADNKFTNTTGGAPSEEQLAAFIYRNGPVATGINANVFGLRVKGCEASSDCFITKAMCNDPTIKGKGIDHSITLVGFGTDVIEGDYWLVKNSWSTKFGNDGFIKVARGINCADIDCCGSLFAYGDPATYYE